MTRKILVVTFDSDLLSTIKDELKIKLSDEFPDITVETARNKESAEIDLKKLYDLIIINVDIPEDAHTPINYDENLGITFINSISEDINSKTPKIFISQVRDKNIDDLIADLDCCDTINLGPEKSIEDLVNLSKKYLIKSNKINSKSKNFANKHGRVDIFLDLNNKIWTYLFDDGQTGALEIDISEIERIISFSQIMRHIEDPTAWRIQLKNIGQSLVTTIFHKNATFNSEFEEYEKEHGNKENIKIRFIVEETIHSAALEALCEIDQENFWMLDRPIFRKLNVNTNKSPLFQDTETLEYPINVLIIQSITHGKVPNLTDENNKIVEFDHISDVRNECEALFTFFSDNRSRLNVDKIEIINEDIFLNNQTSLKDCLIDKLSNEKWHIVHFAGHSYYDFLRKKAYIFFPTLTQKGESTEYIEADGLSLYLRNADTRLLYLSSCDSSAEKFPFEIAKRQIPAIIGFRWNVKDNLAKHHAKTFYRYLFDEPKDLEYAFLKTRQRMYLDHKEDTIWAAPILILQQNN